jgi:hypothetical protein
MCVRITRFAPDALQIRLQAGVIQVVSNVSLEEQSFGDQQICVAPDHQQVLRPFGVPRIGKNLTVADEA